MEPPAGFTDFVLELLEPLGGVTARRMFGGGGLFRDGLMFAIIDDDTLFMKVYDGNRPAFEAAGTPPFTYRREGREIALSSHAAPPELFDDADELCAWARASCEVALRARDKKG